MQLGALPVRQSALETLCEPWSHSCLTELWEERLLFPGLQRIYIHPSSLMCSPQCSSALALLLFRASAAQPTAGRRWAMLSLFSASYLHFSPEIPVPL